MDFSSICRLCLGNKRLYPISSSSSVFITTGIRVEEMDGLPQNICKDCVTEINSILQFRENCQKNNQQLIKIKDKTKCHKHKKNVKYGLEFEDVDVKIEPVDSDDDKPLNQLKNHSVDFEVTHRNSNVEETIPDSPDSVAETTELDLKQETSEELETNVPYTIDVKSKRVTCGLCQMNLSMRSIDAHMSRRHPGADLRKVKCDLCDNYIMKEKINRHIVMMHQSDGALKCYYCKSEYESKASLVEHVATCGAKKKKRKENDSSRELQECDICHKTMQKGSLRMHKAIKHAGLGPVCEHCGKRFGNKFRLNEHYRAKHGYEKFKCSYCEFQSASIMALRNHERRHRGEKPFICESCGAKFHAAYLLAQHRHKHRTERTVKCEQCPASFKATNSLHSHRQSCHSGCLYRCTLCSRTYASRHYAVKHLRYVHRFKDPVPPLQRLPNTDQATY